MISLNICNYNKLFGKLKENVNINLKNDSNCLKQDKETIDWKKLKTNTIKKNEVHLKSKTRSLNKQRRWLCIKK
jgi:hypothetical protein